MASFGIFWLHPALAQRPTSTNHGVMVKKLVLTVSPQTLSLSPLGPVVYWKNTHTLFKSPHLQS